MNIVHCQANLCIDISFPKNLLFFFKVFIFIFLKNYLF